MGRRTLKREGITVQVKLVELDNIEANLQKFPMFCVSRKEMSSRNKIEYKLKARDEDGRIIERGWKVTKNPEFRGNWAGAFAFRTFLALQQKLGELLKEGDFVENPIYLSIYDLCKKMGIQGGGHNFELVRNALKFIHGLRFSSYGIYYSKADEGYLGSVTKEKSFYLICRLEFDRLKIRSRKMRGKTRVENCRVWFDEVFLDNLNEWYVSKIDISYALSLDSGLALRIYSIVDSWFFAIRNKEDSPPFIQTNYSNLCKQIPIKEERYFSKVKQQFKLALVELTTTKFLEKFHWSRTSKVDFLLKMWPGERVKLEMAERRRRYKRFQNTFGKK